MQESGECGTEKTGEVVARAEVLIDEAKSTLSSDARVGVWQTPQHVTCFGGIRKQDAGQQHRHYKKGRSAKAFGQTCAVFPHTFFDNLLQVSYAFHRFERQFF
jgi:hypothetical protein